MNYRSVADLNSTCKYIAENVRNDYDLIVGIPRSGLIPGTLIALYLNKPIADVDDVVQMSTKSSGKRMDGDLDWRDVDKILIVDDSVNTGTEMRRVKSKLKNYKNSYQIDFLAAYASKEGTSYVDFYGEIVERPRVFEWNIMNHRRIENWCVTAEDILYSLPDGPIRTPEQYKQQLESSTPLTVPAFPIGVLVSEAPPSFKHILDAWLEENDISYNELHCIGGLMSSNAATSELTSEKSKIFQDSGCELYIEYSNKTALEVSQKSSKIVYSKESNELVKNFTPVERRIQQCREIKRKLMYHYESTDKSNISFLKKVLGHIFKKLKIKFDHLRSS